MEPSGAVMPQLGGRLFRRRRERLKSIQWKRRKHLGQNNEIARHLLKPLTAGAPPLIHVDGAVEFELDRYAARRPGCRNAR